MDRFDRSLTTSVCRCICETGPGRWPRPPRPSTRTPGKKKKRGPRAVLSDVHTTPMRAHSFNVSIHLSTYTHQTVNPTKKQTQNSSGVIIDPYVDYHYKEKAAAAAPIYSLDGALDWIGLDVVYTYMYIICLCLYMYVFMQLSTQPRVHVYTLTDPYVSFTDTLLFNHTKQRSASRWRASSPSSARASPSGTSGGTSSKYVSACRWRVCIWMCYIYVCPL
jgi:hypothetical protein